MHVIKSSIDGSPNVGLFGYATPKAVLIGRKLKRRQKAEFEEVLGLPVITCRIAGTDLPGVFLAGNRKTTLVPAILFESEQKFLEGLETSFTVMQTQVTCLGNAIACNDNGAILSTEFNDTEVAFIKKELGVPAVQLDIAGLTTPGAVIVINGGHAIVHKDASEAEIGLIEKTLGVHCEPATVNLGSPHLNAGILHSDHGFIIGELSGGPEIVNIDEELGYHVVEG